MNEEPCVEQLGEDRTDEADVSGVSPGHSAALGWLRDFSVAALVVLLMGIFVVQPFRVDGRSMEPLLLDGQRILVNKLVYRIGAVSRGDVVIVAGPKGQALVKRVVGLPGDEVSIHRGVVWIEGRALVQDYVEESRRSAESMAPRQLGPDQYFVLGDHRAVSHDSRVFGAVERSAIRGRASFRYWPLGQWGSIPSATGS